MNKKSAFFASQNWLRRMVMLMVYSATNVIYVSANFLVASVLTIWRFGNCTRMGSRLIIN